MIRVLHVVPRFGQGGVSRVISNLVGGDTDDIRSMVACDAAASDPGQGISASCVDAPLHPSSARNFFLGCRALRRIVERHEISLIHSHHRFSSLVGSFVARSKGIHFVSSVHDFAAGRRMTTRVALGSEIMVYSGAVEHFLRDEMRVRAHITRITMGVPPPSPVSPESVSALRRELRLEPSQPCILFAGRLEMEKAPDVLIQAIPFIKSHIPNAVVIFAGDGPMRPELEAAVREASLQDAVRFLGWRRDTDLLMAAADLVILLRRGYEAVGLTVLEAMWIGKPVVAVDAGALSSIIDDGRTGIVLQDLHPQPVADAVVRILTDRDFATRLGQAARDAASHRWTLGKMIAETHSVYRRITTN